MPLTLPIDSTPARWHAGSPLSWGFTNLKFLQADPTCPHPTVLQTCYSSHESRGLGIFSFSNQFVGLAGPFRGEIFNSVFPITRMYSVCLSVGRS